MTLAELLENSSAAVLEVKPGEVLLIKAHGRLTTKQGSEIIAHTRHVLPGVPLLIIDDEIDITVAKLHPEQLPTLARQITAEQIRQQHAGRQP